nr:cell wall protein DAN4-like isoform X1 [Penaeus vannamei]
MRVQLLLCVLGAVGALGFSDEYYTWAANLQPGYVIESFLKDGRVCHCKVPGNFTSTSTTTTTTSTTSTSTSTTTSTSSTSTSTTTSTSTSTSTSTTTSTSSTTSTSTTTSTSNATTTSNTTSTPSNTTTSNTTSTPSNTTTSNTTSTSSTTSTSTSTSTSTTTTTSTSTSTSTTTSTTTTTTIGTITYDCNKTIHISHDSVDTWTSPNYPDDYPEDICCVLTLITSSTSPLFMVKLTYEGQAEIYKNSKCSTDSLTFSSGEIQCGILPSSSYFFTGKYTVTFKTSSADGGTATGFNMTITGIDGFQG